MLRPEREGITEFNLERTLESTGHSEDLVRRLVSGGVHNEQVHTTITRNIEHIKIILGKEQVALSGSPRLDDFREAIALGEAFVAAE